MFSLLKSVVTTLAVFAALTASQVLAGGYQEGQVVNGYRYSKGWFYGKTLAYKPYYYGQQLRYDIKSYAPVDVKSRLLDLAQQKASAQEAIDLARVLGLSAAEVQSTVYQQSSGYGHSPLYNALASGQAVQYGNGSSIQSATSFVVQSNANFDFNASAERNDRLKSELIRALSTSTANDNAIVQQLAQIVGVGAQVAATQTQAAVTIAEKEEGTKQLELLLQAVLAVQPKDKAAVNWNSGTANGGGPYPQQPQQPIPQQPPNQIFSAPVPRGLETCTTCHGEGGRPKAIAAARFDGLITDTLFTAAVSAMASGEMPPAEFTASNGRWTDAETVQTIAQLRGKMR